MNEQAPVFTIRFDTTALPPGEFWSRGTITLEGMRRDRVTFFTKTRQFRGSNEIQKVIQELQRDYDEED